MIFTGEDDMIFIRTDANETIATGHVMRCLTIAEQLVSLGETVMFIVSDEESSTLIKEKGFPYENLNSNYAQPDNVAEIEKMRQILSGNQDLTGAMPNQSNEHPKLLMDSYSISASYMRKLSTYAKTIYIDDLFEEQYPVDMIVNYTLYYDRFDYAGRYAKMDTKLLLGGKFVPLRKAFAPQEKLDCMEEADKTTDKLKVLVICGGGDQFNVMGSIFARMEALKLESGQYEVENYEREEHTKQQNGYLCDRYHYYVVAGAYNPNKPYLLEFAKRYTDVEICENVEDMATLMRTCDIAISAASTVLYECCAVQLPTIFFCVADNQKYDKECFTKEDIMLYAGDVRLEKERTIDNILAGLQKLAKDEALREYMKKQMSHIVDGKGAARIAESIVQL
jgi:spore coat polysaccharide biosynthesis predicted glycosyltransferase SpsG